MSLAYAGTDTTGALTYQIYVEPSPTAPDEKLPCFKTITLPRVDVAVVSLPEAASFVIGFPHTAPDPWVVQVDTSGPYRSMDPFSGGTGVDFQHSAGSSAEKATLAFPSSPYAFLENLWNAAVPADTTRWSTGLSPLLVRATKPVGDTLVSGGALGTPSPPGVTNYLLNYNFDDTSISGPGIHPLGVLVELGFGGQLVMAVYWLTAGPTWNSAAFEFLPPPTYGFPATIATACYVDGIVYLSQFNAATTGPFATMAIALTPAQVAGFTTANAVTGAAVAFPTAGVGADGDFTFTIGGTAQASPPPLRLGQRNDGLGPIGHPRVGGQVSSTQLTVAPRVGGKSTYS